MPKDAVPFGRHYYKVFWGRLSWQEAKARCEKMGGRLACIETAEQKTFLAALKGDGKAVWLGAHRTGKGHWEWVDGKQFDPRQLNKSPPASFDYVVFHAKNGFGARPQNGHVKNIAVPDIQGFICQWE